MKAKGQITVFLSLVLLLVLSLLCTCLESARSAGLHYRLRIAADSAIQSVFAVYDSSLFEKYQLLFYQSNDAGGSRISEMMKTYGSYYADVNQDSGKQGLDWFSMEIESVELSNMVFATDQEGAVFEHAVMDYMKTGSISVILGELRDHLDITDAEGNLTTAGQKVLENEKEEEFSIDQILREYEKIQETLASEAEAENAEEGGGEGAASAGEGEEEQVSYNVIDKIKDVIQYGIFAFVISDPSRISSGEIAGENLPSHLGSDIRQRKAEGSPIEATSGGLGGVENLLCNEYLIRFFDCYTSENEDADYELEYIIAGEDTHKENLKKVVNRLLWIREGLNLTYLLGDGEKRAAADALAASLIGWTGLPPLVTAFSGLILAAWSVGESILDVRILLSGGKIPLIKSSEDWNLSLEGVMSLSTGFSPDNKSEEEEKGLSYEDYLRILLFLTPSSEKDYRAMDIIQINLRKINPSFQMSQCVYSTEAAITVTAEFRFLQLPFLQKDSYGNVSGYRMKKNTKFSY